MAGPFKTPKPLNTHLKALDDHQFLLRGMLHGLNDDLAYIKTIASELRTLVCLSSKREGLLWRLIDDLGVSDVLNLAVAESVKRDSPLNHSLSIWKLPFSRFGHLGFLPEPTSFRQVIKECEAIYAGQPSDKIVTHELLIKSIAEQMGGAHEDQGLDFVLDKLNSYLLNDRQLFLDVLALDAELTLQLGERVLDHAEKNRGYQRAIRPTGEGDVTLCARFSQSGVLAGSVPVFSLISDVAEASITVSANPTSTSFTLSKRGKDIGNIQASHPPIWDESTDALFAFSYSSNQRKCRTVSNSKAGALLPCDFGWLDARECRIEPNAAAEGFVFLSCVPLYSRLLSPAECGMLLTLSPDGREIFTTPPIADIGFPE